MSRVRDSDIAKVGCKWNGSLTSQLLGAWVVEESMGDILEVLVRPLQLGVVSRASLACETKLGAAYVTSFTT